MTGWVERATRLQRAAQRVLGEDVIYTPIATGVPVEIRGVFTDAYVRVELVEGVAVESSSPALSVHLDDLAAAPAKDDTALVRGRLYVVRSREPDGEGDSRLILRGPTP